MLPKGVDNTHLAYDKTVDRPRTAVHLLRNALNNRQGREYENSKE